MLGNTTCKSAETVRSKGRTIFQELSDKIKRPNKKVIVVPKGMEREARFKDVFNAILNENFPSMD